MSADPSTLKPLRILTLVLAAGSTAIIPINLYVFGASLFPLFFALAALQFFLGFAATACAVVDYTRRTKMGAGKVWPVVFAVFGALVGLGGPAGAVLGFLAMAVGSMGGAWGRPLRVKGRVLHPELCVGSDWTRGARPDPTGLDAATRTALEALWLHDAQKEHASVPAFSRLSWLLTAIGAPAELVVGAHQAAMEEIDHTRRCFALAAGYGGRSHSVEAMPDLLLGGLDLPGDPLVYLAVESLRDGCLLEDFNADVAAVCESVCKEPVTKDVLGRIAREERSHAEFSWASLAWLCERGGERVTGALREAVSKLAEVPRPTAASAEKAPLVAAADATKLRDHGRLADAEWAALWDLRVTATTRRARALLDGEALAEAA